MPQSRAGGFSAAFFASAVDLRSIRPRVPAVSGGWFTVRNGPPDVAHHFEGSLLIPFNLSAVLGFPRLPNRDGRPPTLARPGTSRTRTFHGRQPLASPKMSDLRTFGEKQAADTSACPAPHLPRILQEQRTGCLLFQINALEHRSGSRGDAGAAGNAPSLLYGCVFPGAVGVFDLIGVPGWGCPLSGSADS